MIATLDDKLAVAQHYGIPTHLVSFTTDPTVAAFFATFDPPAQTAKADVSCILCLDPSDLIEFSHLPEPPETIVPEIPGLQTLRAQHSVFLYYPYVLREHADDVEYETGRTGIHRICFPPQPRAAGLEGRISAADVFPAPRTDVEIALNTYFAGARRSRPETDLTRSSSHVVARAPAGTAALAPIDASSAETSGVLGEPPPTSRSAQVYETSNIASAMRLAYELRDEGRYTWFRGQTKAWPPHSTRYRVVSARNSAALGWSDKRLAALRTWVASIRELEYLHRAGHDHDFFAVAQHYGLATHYIDFTTDPGVASFFAADTAHPDAHSLSCIYCLNADDLRRVADSARHSALLPGRLELVELDVRNLWRLQAQCGTFVIADYAWDVTYELDRIVFPYSGYPAFPTRDQIYPEDASYLEDLLEQFFFLERLEMEYERPRFVGSVIRARELTLESWPDGTFSDAFAEPGRVASSPSWSGGRIAEWQQDRDEAYGEATGKTVKLQLSSDASPEETGELLTAGVWSATVGDPTLRSKAVEWILLDLATGVGTRTLARQIRKLWNGMRRLPYTNDDIADAIGATAALAISNPKAEATDLSRNVVASWQTRDTRPAEASFVMRYGECLSIELGTANRGQAIAFVSRHSLVGALRADLDDLLNPEYRGQDIARLLYLVQKPMVLFDFNQLQHAFAREIIPAQMLLGQPLVLFNPADLTALGLA